LSVTPAEFLIHPDPTCKTGPTVRTALVFVSQDPT
jgi:hypothetical protein